MTVNKSIPFDKSNRNDPAHERMDQRLNFASGICDFIISGFDCPDDEPSSFARLHSSIQCNIFHGLRELIDGAQEDAHKALDEVSK